MRSSFRIIPTLLLNDSELYKTVRFKKPKYIGDPINAIKIFNEKEVDEIIVIDIGVTKNKSSINFDLIGQIAGECFMPMTYGGGIKTMEDVDKLFSLGIEKICIQSKAIDDFGFLKLVSDKYGSQAVVLSVDFKKNIFGKKNIFSFKKNSFLKCDWREFLDRAQEFGAGEILATFIDHEGTKNGIDVKLLSEIVKYCKIPVIGQGGVGSNQDIYDGYLTGVGGIAVGTFFVLNGPHDAVLITYTKTEDLINKVNKNV